MSEQNTTFSSNGGSAHGYLELPPGGSGPGVVVIQEWWGLTTHIADLTRRLAASGFVALAPDLYGGRVAHDAEEAQQMMAAMPTEQAVRDLGGAVDHLLGLDAVTTSTVGSIGFCMGGGFVLALAGERPDEVSAACPFYGLPPSGVRDDVITAAVQGHYGKEDTSVPLPAVQEAFDRLSARPDAVTELHVYDAGHAFVNPENTAGHDPEAARTAWDRATAFLHEHIR
jgi:carboxymethylenebutenolidase